MGACHSTNVGMGLERLQCTSFFTCGTAAAVAALLLSFGQAWVSCHNRDARKATLAAYTLLAGGQHAVAQLGLAPNSEWTERTHSVLQLKEHMAAYVKEHESPLSTMQGVCKLCTGTPSLARQRLPCCCVCRQAVLLAGRCPW